MMTPIISTIHKVTMAFLIFILLLLGIVFGLLTEGITVNSLDTSGIKLERLYLKLDKKLTAKIGHLSVPRGHGPATSLDETRNIFANLHLALDYFDTIIIDSLQIGEHHAEFAYGEGKLLAKTDLIEIKTSFKQQDDLLLLAVENLNLIDQQFHWEGALEYNLKSESYRFDGLFSLPGDIQGDLQGQGTAALLTFSLNTQPFPSLAPLKKSAPFNEDVQQWVFHNVTGESFQLQHFQGEINLDDPESSPFEKLKGQLDIKKAKVRFKEGVESVLSPHVEIALQNGNLNFKLHQPRHHSKNLEGSHVTIQDIFGSAPSLSLYLITDSPLDSHILKILEAYKIHLTLKQKNSNPVHAQLWLDVDLNTEDLTEARGTFNISQSDLQIGSFEFTVDEGLVTLHNDIVTVEQADVGIGEEMLDGNVSLRIDPKAYQVTGEVDIRRFWLHHMGETLLDLRDTPTAITITFDGPTHVDLPGLKSRFTVDKNFTFQADDLALFVPYSPVLQADNIRQGNLHLKTADFENFQLQGELTEIDLPFLKNGIPLTSLPFHATIEGDEGVSYATPDGTFKGTNTAEGKQLTINGLDLNISDSATANEKDDDTPVTITGTNSNLIFGSRTVLADRYTITKQTDTIEINLDHMNGSAKILKQNDTSSITGQHLSHRFFNTLIKSKLIAGGLLDINATDENNITQGRIVVQNARLKDLGALNNLFAFIDTVPSLITLRDPGFSEKGYIAEKGYVDFILQDGNLTIKELLLKGKSLDISANGYIDLDKETIQMDVYLRSIKGLGSIIKNIPIVGYIIIGDNGAITTTAKISGNLNDPDISSKIIQDTLETPFRIIERLFKTPGRLFE